MAAETFRNLVADREIHRRVRRADLRVHQRDLKGLYAKAQAGQIRNLTVFHAPYEGLLPFGHALPQAHGAWRPN